MGRARSPSVNCQRSCSILLPLAAAAAASVRSQSGSGRPAVKSAPCYAATNSYDPGQGAFAPPLPPAAPLHLASKPVPTGLGSAQPVSHAAEHHHPSNSVRAVCTHTRAGPSDTKQRQGQPCCVSASTLVPPYTRAAGCSAGQPKKCNSTRCPSHPAPCINHDPQSCTDPLPALQGTPTKAAPRGEHLWRSCGMDKAMPHSAQYWPPRMPA
jgi:hypothetical protein